MSITESLLISVYGMGVVFILLIVLCFLVMLQSRIFGAIANSSKKKEAKLEEVKIESASDYTLATAEDEDITCGELKLLGVDKRTAAMIMAIVSDESNIPLSELRFKMIKAIDKN